MPAYALRWAGPQEQDSREPPSLIYEELEACTEVQGVGRNKLRRFLLETGVHSIAEMDYPLRWAYEKYLKEKQNIRQTDHYLLAFDRVKQFSIRQQMQTLAGR